MAEELTGTPPSFPGSTGGLLRKAEVEEKYAIKWTSDKAKVFEMPTGGSATMVEGDNLLYLARKEQCLALGAQLRSKFKTDYQVFRIYPNGDTEYLHPKDGVYPEKVNEGREIVNMKPRSIGENPEPAKLKFSGTATYNA